MNGLNKAGAGFSSLRDRDGNEDTWLAMVLLSNLCFSSLRLFVFAACLGSTSFLGRPRALFLLGELGAPVSFWELDVSGSLEPSGLLTNCTSSFEASGRTACWASYTSFVMGNLYDSRRSALQFECSKAVHIFHLKISILAWFKISVISSLFHDNM